VPEEDELPNKQDTLLLDTKPAPCTTTVLPPRTGPMLDLNEETDTSELYV
jgi:hypothetical protein